MVKKLKKDALSFTKGILSTSIGAGVAGNLGTSLGGYAGTAATKGAAGLSTMAGYYPAMGSALGGRGVIRILKKAAKRKR